MTNEALENGAALILLLVVPALGVVSSCCELQWEACLPHAPGTTELVHNTATPIEI